MLHRPLRVLVVDTEYRYSVGGSLCRGFQALGHDTYFFDQKRWLGSWTDPSRRARTIRAAIRPVAIPALNLALLVETFAWKPDVVLVLKGNSLLPETIAALKQGTRAVVSFQPDDLENPLNTNDWMRQSLPLWDVLFTPRAFAGPELETRGVRHWEHLPFGYDPLLSHPAPNTPLPEPGIENCIVFAGTWAPERAALIEPLATRLPWRIWGSGWERIPSSSLLTPSLRHKQLLDESLCAVLSQAAISLALLRKGNRDRHQMRTFEVPACGGFMLAERSEDHLALFEEGREAVFFNGPGEFLAQADRYLADRTLRRRIAEAGHRRLLAGHHSYQDRAARIVEVVSEL